MKQLAALLDAKISEDPLSDAALAPLVERHLCLDRGYDYAACREAAIARGYEPHIPPQRSAAHPLPPPGHPDRHPPRRWVVEVAHRWCNRFRRLLIRWDKRATHYLAFVHLAACLIIYRKVRHARTSLG
jgi:putative transposase